jgi:hypothetical protein
MSPETARTLAQLNKGFMKPEICYLDSKELKKIDWPQDMISDEGCCPEPGWFHRLSAPGYLDCTDWCGPFDTRGEAEEACAEVYSNE